MKKKKSGGGGANWMDTYGDMVTLLLCFFVLLYSMSTIDTDKWKALVQSFNPQAVLTTTDPNGAGGPFADPEFNDQSPGIEPPTDPEPTETQSDIDDAIEMLYQAMQAYAESQGLQQSINVTKDGGKVFVSFKDTAFFDGDSPVIREDAKPILNAFCEMLSTHAWAINYIYVEGHTAQAGDTPNNPRNDWNLSSDRATNVVIYIHEHTDNAILNPGKLATIGHGQWQPIADNSTADGKAANRRVEFEISGRDLEQELADQIKNYETQDYSTTTAGTTTDQDNS